MIPVEQVASRCRAHELERKERCTCTASRSHGIVVVVENSCNPTFTYQVNGPTVTYLGTGDFHDSAYEHLEISSQLLDLRKFAVKASTYSGVPINEDLIAAFENHKVHEAVTECCKLRPPVDISLFAETSTKEIVIN